MLLVFEITEGNGKKSRQAVLYLSAFNTTVCSSGRQFFKTIGSHSHNTLAWQRRRRPGGRKGCFSNRDCSFLKKVFLFPLTVFCTLIQRGKWILKFHNNIQYKHTLWVCNYKAVTIWKNHKLSQGRLNTTVGWKSCLLRSYKDCYCLTNLSKLAVSSHYKKFPH